MKKLTLLGGLTPAQFLRDYWHKQPLLIRQAIPGFKPLIKVEALAELAGKNYVESRLITCFDGQWEMQHGPLAALPDAGQQPWTMLVQGANLFDAKADALLRQFRFVPDARLDDLMISVASDGGGVGPHFDSYDVFLLQAQGRRRWRIGAQKDLSLVEGMPLKILANFTPDQEFVLEPGDMLYLPPRYAHDGIAEGECQTYSIGFRAPAQAELARELLQRIADAAAEGEGEPRLYRDPAQEATGSPGAVPDAMAAFARDAVAGALKDPLAVERALGEYLTEPKSNVWFEAARVPKRLRSVVLDARTRMLHDRRHVFINGEAWRAAGRDAALMRELADRRSLDAKALQGASDGALDLLRSWCEAGWLHANGGAT